MAEFCKPCWENLNDIKLADNEVKLSKGTTLCEGCGEFKNTILKVKHESCNLRKSKHNRTSR